MREFNLLLHRYLFVFTSLLPRAFSFPPPVSSANFDSTLRLGGNRLLQFVKNETSRSWRNVRNRDEVFGSIMRIGIVPPNVTHSPASSNFVHQRDWIRAILPSNNQNCIATPFSSAFRTRKLKSSLEYRPSFSNSRSKFNNVPCRSLEEVSFLRRISRTICSRIRGSTWPQRERERERNNHATHTLLTKSLIFRAASVIYQKRITLGKASS